MKQVKYLFESGTLPLRITALPVVNIYCVRWLAGL